MDGSEGEVIDAGGVLEALEGEVIDPIDASAPASPASSKPMWIDPSKSGIMCKLVMKDVCFPSPQNDGTFKDVCSQLPHMECGVGAAVVASAREA